MSYEYGKTEKDSSVINARHSELADYGFCQDIGIEIGEQLISEDYGSGARLIRLS